jgi:hypothetical protein
MVRNKGKSDDNIRWSRYRQAKRPTKKIGGIQTVRVKLSEDKSQRKSKDHSAAGAQYEDKTQ